MAARCLYEPTESGHCATCGAAYPVSCPMTGTATDAAAAASILAAAFGAATVAARALAAAFKALGELIERTADDDRA